MKILSLLLAVGIAIGLLAQSASAHSIVITETSSTALTVTYDGSAVGVSVNYISTDHWGVTIGYPVTFSANPQWTEPEDPSAFNVITLLSAGNQFIVNSDYLDNSTPPLTNGATFANFGTDSRDGGSISLTFRDRGDVAAVPDAGSTLGLLLLAFVALFGANRFRSPRLA